MLKGADSPTNSVVQGEEVFWDLKFRRDFHNWEVTEFQRLLALLQGTLSDSHDTIRWNLGNNKVFSIKSFYEKFLVREEDAFPYNSIWIPKVPRKVCLLG